MIRKLQDIIAFRSDLLFDGAVNIDWFLTDERRRSLAAESFVFHGPKYHGVSQEDIGRAHGHRLEDSASFACSIIKRCYGIESQPFTLAIAGYGTGKSHLALTLAMLLSDPSSATAKAILTNIKAADPEIEKEVRSLLKGRSGPCLVVALNGMKNFDLTAELTKQVKQQLRAIHVDTGALDDVRPRFGQAANIIKMSKEKVVNDLLKSCDVKSVDAVLEALDNQDELIYTKVQEFYEAQGSRIRALGGESLQEVIDTICRQYCGEAKPFRNLAILFDEFGRYTEFATISKHIAGSGVLQDLFEGIQSNSEKACFIGFIQFELNAYVQRVASEYKNEIIRYITRYEIADKVYLSINLETLIANLLEKKDTEILDEWFDSDNASSMSYQIASNLHNWFPLSLNHRLWNDEQQFHSVIRKGCWPLSPYSTWFLFHLAAAGKHLQQRSALALLAKVLPKYSNVKMPTDEEWSLTPVDLWSDQLQEELINSEEGGQQGAITLAYSSVFNRHSAQLSTDQVNILRAIVLASKMGLRVDSRDEAMEALTALAGLSSKTVIASIEKLQDEFNVIEWDEGFKVFEILGDAVPRTAFLAFLRKQIDSLYDENSRAELFMAKAPQWSVLLGDIECDFAEKHEITTKEWNYQSVTSNMNSLEMHLNWAKLRWDEAIDVDTPRGTIIYCYLERSRDPRSAESEIKKLIRNLGRETKIAAIPILIVLLYDESGALGQTLAELAVLQDQLKEEDRARFGKLIPAHQEKTTRALESQIEGILKERKYIPFMADGKIASQRMAKIGTELFEHIYGKVIPFPFDGFSTARGNAADTCQVLTSDLLNGKLDFDSVISKPAKLKNRAVAVLQECWQVFTKDGAIAKRPLQNNIREIIDGWDELLKSADDSFNLGNELRSLCKPPYGANLASAGLLLGVFIAARTEKLIVLKNGTQHAVSQWLQDGVFKGKFLDHKGLQDVYLAFVGEVASEWVNLFDGWDEAESYLEQAKLYQKGTNLRARIPIPPGENYRFELMERQAMEALGIMKKMESAQDDALSKLDNGLEKDDVSLISWGASALAGLTETMKAQQPRWTREQIDQFQPQVDSARQKIIQIFPQWLKRQTLLSTKPDAVGEFKHKMLRNIGGSLQKLELTEQHASLETHVASLVRDIEITAVASQLERDINGWLLQNKDALKIVRLKEIIGLIDVAKNYDNKLREMSKKKISVDLSAVLADLVQFQGKLDVALRETRDRGYRISQSKIESASDINKLIQEVKELCNINEGCEQDLQDFQVWRTILNDYDLASIRLHDEKLTWKELDRMASKLKEDIENRYGEEDTPWKPEQTIANLVKQVTESRNKNSTDWIATLVTDADDIDKLPVADANRLYDRASNPPAFVTDEDLARINSIKVRIEDLLKSLALEWLIEKFLELPTDSKRKFLQMANQKMGE